MARRVLGVLTPVAARVCACVALALVVLLQIGLAVSAHAQQPGDSFDHLSTGFDLSGSHQIVRCETCHINGVFKGTPRDCATCHAQGNPRGASSKSTKHIPTNATCETCHSSGLTSFSGVVFSHVTVRDAASCQNCHDGVHASGKSVNHIRTTEACSACHNTTSFAGSAIPANHIPTSPQSTCKGCHTSSDFKVMPSIAAIHANAPSTNSNCAQCHSSANAAALALPSMVPPLVSPPSNHIGMGSLGCENCHAGPNSSFQLPVQSGAKFANSAFNHSGITSGCATCHGPNVTSSSFFGISSIVVMPSASGPGPNAHLPTTTNCETCHQASTPVGLIPGRAAKSVGPGTGFMLPAPTAAMIHAGTTGGCSSCHETNSVWLGLNQYPMSGFLGFQTRPQAAAGPFNVADASHPATGECSQCHVGFSFNPNNLLKPSNHIPTSASATCTACHTSPDFKVMPSVTAIHANAPSTSSNCAQCHSSANAAAFASPTMSPSLVGPPGNHLPTGSMGCENCHVGPGSSLQLPVQNGARFSNSAFNHTGINSGCASCHGPDVTNSSFFGVSSIVVMPSSSGPGPSAHLPTSTNCEACHQASTPAGLVASIATKTTGPGTGFMLPAPTAAMIHGGTTGGCSSCHETNSVWLGVSQYPMSGFLGFQTRPQAAAGQFNVADASHPASGECSQCHIGFSFDPSNIQKPSNHIPTSPSAACSACHASGDFSVMPTITAIHANAPSTSGNCAQCHSSANAAAFSMPTMIPPLVGPPGNHVPMGSLGCEGCHVGSSSSLQLPVQTGAKFSNSAFSHTGITAGCATCHGGSGSFYGVTPKTTSGLSPQHVPTSASCENCHINSVPSVLIPVSGVTSGMTTFANAQFSHNGITSGCITCHGPNASSYYGITNIITQPPSGSPGANSHIPLANGANCENCHLSNMPNAVVPANASTAVPGTMFQSPAPTGAMIHAGVTGGCSACHETGSSWLGVGLYPRSPTTLTVGGSYTGFHARPNAAGGTYSITDAAHPVGGDCSNCHASTTSFTTAAKPTNHIPTSASATCTSCHTSLDFSVMPPIGLIHANAPSTNSNCAQCHGSAAASYAIPSAGFSIVSTPGSHIPMGSLDCVSCHVGSNSSISATPVPDGAKFSNSAFSHSGITAGCATCHGGSGSFYGVTPKTMVGLSPQHVPTSAACENCHINSVPSVLIPVAGATGGMTTFANAQFSHTGISSGCNNCHGANITGSSFYGITNIVVLPPSGSPGATSHIPSPNNANCESCHSGSKPNTLVPGNATATVPGSLFQSPAPTGAMIHSGIVSGCSTCHETGASWLGVSLYPGSPSVLTPGATYTGFQARPNAAGGTYSITDSAHPVGGDCSNCHASTTSFTAGAKPTNHIPTSASATCGSCHTSSDFSVIPSIGLIHANAPATSSNCAQCHGSAAASYAIPSLGFSIVSTPGSHIPMGSLDCVSCHVGSNSSINATPVPDGAKFSGSLFSHSGITSGCDTCHGPNVTAATFYGVSPIKMAGLSPAHVPTSAACETCHVNSVPTGLVPAAGMKTFSGAQFSHAGITSGCETCHGPGLASSFFGITSIVMPPTSPASISSHLPTSTSCQSCHIGSVPSGLVPAVTTKTAGVNSGFLLPAPTASMIHAGVTGSCNSCHDAGSAWMSMGQYPITRTAPFKGFQMRPKASSDTFVVVDSLHPMGGDCSDCHGSFSDFTEPSKPANHIPTSAAAGCPACHTTSNFATMPSITAIHANAPSQTSNCAQCHGAAAATFAIPAANFAIKTTAANHIPMGSLGCESCHVGSNSSLTLPVTNGATFANSAFSHSGITSGCKGCHGINVAAGTFDGVTPKSNGNLAPPHVPVSNSTPCETCHLNSIPSTLIPLAGASGGMTTFAGAQFIHSGITSGCVTCHGPNITNSSFFGVTKIIVMPPSVASGATSHLPTSTTCESCHLGSTPAALVPGVSTRSTPGSGFLTPKPTASMIHAGVTGGCASCHDTNKVWMSVGQYPITTSAPFKGFQTRPQVAAGTFYVADAAHPTTGECSNCHASLSDFTVSAMPANHIPIKSGAACTTCHTDPDFAVMPTIANIHAYAPSSTTNCAQCHSTTNAANFAMPTMTPAIKAPPSTHIPMGSLGCESCHVGSNSSVNSTVQNASKFSGSAFSHTGITTGCAICHGNTIVNGTFYGVTPKTMVGLSPAHVPTTAACENCHVNVPSGLVPLSGTGFSFAGGKFSHGGIVSGCDTCHGATISGSSFYGISSIVVLPPTTPTGANSHIPSVINSKCESCHLQSTPAALVAANATLSVPNTAFKTPAPTGAMIHANTSNGCVSCHESGMSWLGVGLYTRSPTTYVAGATYIGFQARPNGTGTGYSVLDSSHPTTGDCSQCHGSTVNFTVSAKPANHIPTAANATCTACHTNITGSNANFAVMPSFTTIHANAPTPSSNCAQCHSVANAAIYAIPSAGFTIKAPDVKHVPFGSTPCETCHVGTGSSLQLPVVNGASFAGSLFSHLGITTGCDTCHGQSVTSASFTGISKIVVMPSSSGPGATKHIPSSTVCESCHMGSTPSGLVSVTGSATLPGSAFKLPAPTGAMIHAGVTSGCSSCHETNYTWMSVSQYPISPTVVTNAALYRGFQTRPYGSATTYSVLDAGHPATGDCSQCHDSTTAFTAEGKPAGHMPTTVAACGTCHIAQPDYSYAAGKLASNTILHTGISSGCATCHTAGPGKGPFAGCATQAACSSPPPITYQPKVMPVAAGAQKAHVPSGSTPCEGCHSKTNFTTFSGTSMKTTASHTAVASLTCMSCHELGSAWFGVTGLKVRLANKHTTTARKPPNDCDSSGCHSYNGGFRALVQPIMREAMVNPDQGRLLPNLQVARPTRGSLGNTFDHVGVEPGKCKTCHDGQRASGMPGRHLMVNTSCDTCHRTTSWLPAQFSHNGISPNTCMVCHNGIGASARPSGHFMSARSCDSCHKSNNWRPVMYSHLSPAYQMQPDKLTCVSCHVTNSEIIPRQMRAQDRTKPIPVLK